MGEPLYPLHLVIETPYGVADCRTHQPNPNALKARRVRAPNRRLALDGNSILSFPPQSEGWQLTLAIPDRFGLEFRQALPLQQCKPGDRVTITENLTRRDTQRVWQGAVVLEPDSGEWISGAPGQGDHFSIVMTFFLP